MPFHIVRRWWKIGVLLALIPLAMHCGGSATPTGGTSTPIAVELPAITFPTSIATSVATVVQGNLSVYRAGPPPPISDGDELWFIGPQTYKGVREGLDFLLSIFSAMSCTTAHCEFTSTRGGKIKVDFDSHAFTTPFSHNGTGLTLSRSCVDVSTTLTSSTAYCARVWVDGTRYLIGQFTTRPTSTDKGAGWFLVASTSGELWGVIYDKSTATAKVTSGPFSVQELFLKIPGTVFNGHIAISETTVSGFSTPLVNYNHYTTNDNDKDRESPLHYVARWLDKWFGNITIDDGTTLEVEQCTTLQGVRTTGCSATLTSPDLPDFLEAARSTDYTLPSTTFFPSSPTF